MNPELKVISSPYSDANGEYEQLVAIPAFDIDVSLIHMNRADKGGNGQFLGPDLFFDDLFAMAAKKTFMSCESIIDTEDFLTHGSVHTLKFPEYSLTGSSKPPRSSFH